MTEQNKLGNEEQDLASPANGPVKTETLKAAHTPAPWFVGSKMDEGYALVVSDRPTTKEHEELDSLVCTFSFVKSESEVRANTKLIAAAPDLLAACEAALEWFAGFPHKGDASDFDKSTAADAYSQLESAITKATGR